MYIWILTLDLSCLALRKGHQKCFNMSLENIWLVLGLSFHSAVIRWNVWGRNEARVTVRLIFLLWPLRPRNYYYPDHTQLWSEITNRKPPALHSSHILSLVETFLSYLLFPLCVLWVCLKLILNLYYPKLIRLITLYWLGITEGGDHQSILPPLLALVVLQRY